MSRAKKWTDVVNYAYMYNSFTNFHQILLLSCITHHNIQYENLNNVFRFDFVFLKSQICVNNYNVASYMRI